jgi:hypothetical protein
MLDLGHLAYAAVFDVRMIHLHSGLTMTLGLAYRYELRALNKLLNSATAHPKASQSFAQKRELCRIVSAYRKWHTQLSGELIHLNDRLISPFFYGFLLSNTFFNASAIMFLLYQRHLKPLFKVILFILFAVQFAIAAVTLSAIIPVNYGLYGSTRALFVASNRVRQLQDHWKAAAYYELLHRKKRKPLIICAGPLGTLNRKSVYQVKKKLEQFELSELFFYFFTVFLRLFGLFAEFRI